MNAFARHNFKLPQELKEENTKKFDLTFGKNAILFKKANKMKNMASKSSFLYI